MLLIRECFVGGELQTLQLQKRALTARRDLQKDGLICFGVALWINDSLLEPGPTHSSKILAWTQWSGSVDAATLGTTG